MPWPGLKTFSWRLCTLGINYVVSALAFQSLLYPVPIPIWSKSHASPGTFTFQYILEWLLFHLRDLPVSLLFLILACLRLLFLGTGLHGCMRALFSWHLLKRLRPALLLPWSFCSFLLSICYKLSFPGHLCYLYIYLTWFSFLNLY